MSETRPYKCTDCSRKFSQPRNIHRHMVLSHGKPETTGPFTLALMSPERIPFTDKNCQGERGRKRPLEELHKSAFTPVAKSPNTSPDGKLTPPAKMCRNGNPTKLFITNVKSLREENPFPDITPLDSPDSGKLKIKEEKKSPRHHPYTKPSPMKTSSRQPPRLAPKPPQYAIVQAVNLPTLHAFNVKIERQTSSPPAAVTSAPHVAVPKSRPVTSSHTAVSTAQPSPPARIHTPETLHSITMVDQIRYAAVMTSFDHLVQGYLAHRTYQSLKCFYKCLTTAKQSVELGTMPWWVQHIPVPLATVVTTTMWSTADETRCASPALSAAQVTQHEERRLKKEDTIWRKEEKKAKNKADMFIRNLTTVLYHDILWKSTCFVLWYYVLGFIGHSSFVLYIFIRADRFKSYIVHINYHLLYSF